MARPGHKTINQYARRVLVWWAKMQCEPSPEYGLIKEQRHGNQGGGTPYSIIWIGGKNGPENLGTAIDIEPLLLKAYKHACKRMPRWRYGKRGNPHGAQPIAVRIEGKEIPLTPETNEKEKETNQSSKV